MSPPAGWSSVVASATACRPGPVAHPWDRTSTEGGVPAVLSGGRAAAGEVHRGRYPAVARPWNYVRGVRPVEDWG